MNFGKLTSIGHNLATSVSDGASFLFGAYALDVHGDANRSPDGHIDIDFLVGRITAGSPSDSLAKVIGDSPKVLAELCRKHGAQFNDFAELSARYGVDKVYGPHFVVTVADHQGRRSEERYRGISGQRTRRGHKSHTP